MKILYSFVVFAALATPLSVFAQVSSQSCFSFQNQDVKVQWTAYKTTQKLPVTGQFATVSTVAKNPAATIPTLLLGAQITLDALSSNTGVAIRDSNLLTGFFKSLVSTQITGIITSVTPDASGPNTGTFVMSLNFNGVQKLVTMTYSVDATNTAHSTGSLDTGDYALSTALAALDKICHGYHAGADGVSKVWTNVDLAVTVPLHSASCN